MSDPTEPVEEVLVPEDARVVLSAEAIAQRRAELAREISRDYAGRELLLLCVLKGSIPFFADLARELTVPVHFGCIGLSSYGSGTDSSGEVDLTVDLVEDVSDRQVLVVEDIVDSGRTLARLRQLLEARGPESLRVVALLDKPSRRCVDVVVDYVGFTIPDEFVVGYGLDHAERFRNLPFVMALERA